MDQTYLDFSSLIGLQRANPKSKEVTFWKNPGAICVFHRIKSNFCGERAFIVNPQLDNMSVCFIPPYAPPLYSKTGVYRGIHSFLIFALKHIFWVLVRTTSMRRF